MMALTICCDFDQVVVDDFGELFAFVLGHLHGDTFGQISLQK